MPVLQRVAAVVVASLGLAAVAGPGEPGPSLTPTHLRCEYLTEPLAIDAPRPRLSWELAAVDGEGRGLKQTAYQVEVSTVPTGAGPAAVLWDSGRIASSETCQIEYAGALMGPGQSVWWRVRVWDQAGAASDWSAPSRWSAGLTTPGSWGGARWIADPTPPPAKGLDPLPAPMLRAEFDIPRGKDVARAVVYASALGLYEAHLNGQRVGDHALAPEWTDYTSRIQYQAYDVTPLLRPGANCIGAILGDGWYAGKIGLAGIVPNGPIRAIYGRQPRLLLRLQIRFSDGTQSEVVSDGSWKSTLGGPIVSNDILDGETYNAQQEIAGWDQPGFDASAWTAVSLVPDTKARLVAQPNEPIRVVRQLKPAAIAQPKPGVYVVDMGQNMVGWCRARLRGKPGSTVTLHHAEVLNPDGTIYTANLRGAAQTDRFTFGAAGEQVFEPRFTYHGFRYVEITGLDAAPTVDDIAGMVANSSAPEVGTFECSEPMVNRLWQNILWTQRANLVGVPTDCPQRDERCGWMGDILAFAPTACFNMDMAAFLTKWVPDTRDAQATDGRFADFSPHPYDPNQRFSGVAAWGDAGVFVPWAAYQFYGDKRMLAEQYASAKRWVDYIESKNPDSLWKHSRGNDYGDWLNADTLRLAGWPAKGAEVPKEVFATIFFHRSTQLVSEYARVLGKSAEAGTYAYRAERIRQAFQAAYLKPDGVMQGDTQAGYALALHFGLLPEPAQGAAVARMVERFKPYDGQISTGFHSTLPLMVQLSSRGHNDDAYRLLLNRRMPSWGYEVDHGATTIWERWDGWVEGRGYQDPGMNSFAHYAIGAVGEWMYSTMLGISAASPGFATIELRPRPGPGIAWARGSYRSIRGVIESGWERAPDGLHVRFTVPPNVTARVFLPTAGAAKVRLDGRAFDGHPDLTERGAEDGAVMCTVGSGRYEFVIGP